MSGLTPGPWEACERGDYGDYDGDCVVVLGDDRRIAVVLSSDSDARLIAASRLLFTELERLVTALEPLERNGGWPLDSAGVATLNGARAALAAVKGDRG